MFWNFSVLVLVMASHGCRDPSLNLKFNLVPLCYVTSFSLLVSLRLLFVAFSLILGKFLNSSESRGQVSKGSCVSFCKRMYV